MPRPIACIVLSLLLAGPAMAQDEAPPEPPGVIVDVGPPAADMRGMPAVGMMFGMLGRAGALGPFERMLLMQMMGGGGFDEEAVFMSLLGGPEPPPQVLRRDTLRLIVDGGVVFKIDTATGERVGALAYRAVASAALLEELLGEMDGEERPEAILPLLLHAGSLTPSDRLKLMQHLGADGEEAMIMSFFSGPSPTPVVELDEATLRIIENGTLYTVDTDAMELTGTLRYRQLDGGAIGDEMAQILAAARVEAVTTQSQSNLKQLSMAVMMFAQDHDQTLPGDDWQVALRPYFGNAAILRSPAWGEQPVGYALNEAIVGLNLAEVAQPARTVLLFETPEAAELPVATSEQVPDEGPHNGRLAVGFCDGHVELLTPDELRERLDAAF